MHLVIRTPWLDVASMARSGCCLELGDELVGLLVTGHADGVGEVLSVPPETR